MQNLRAIILAAGKGTRMKSDTPKVLHPVCGRPIISYVLDIARIVGSKKNYVVLGHKSDEIKKHLDSDCTIVKQNKLLGTADAVKRVAKNLKGFNGDLLILCGDTPLLNKNVIKALIRKHRKKQATCTFLTAVVHNPQGYGRIIRDDARNAVGIREDKDAVGLERDINEINAGVYCVNAKELLNLINEIKINNKKKEFYLTDIIELFYEKKFKIETVEAEEPAEALGINCREDLSLAEKFLRKKIVKGFMAQGVTVVDPETTYIDASVRIGRDTIINPFTIIENNVTLGKHCSVGPFARLRPGTKIGNNVQVGNFAEVSRSKLGNHSLMKHFSFLGDANVGSHVNIGAGVVTANYDGQNKNPTKISNNAFIGSDSILVAPVKIGKHAITGAGSVVTKGTVVGDNRVVVGVPAKLILRRKKK